MREEHATLTFPYRLILCPTDFSELATFALRYATELTHCASARLLVLHADPFLPPPYVTVGQMEELSRALERAKDAARRHLAQYVREIVGTTVPVDPLLVEDTPARAILSTAREHGADLIVMGTHGRSGLSRLMLGSVTERVLRETDRPVLTVRYKPEALPEPHVAIRRLLCPVNYTHVASKALHHAAIIAHCFRAELYVLHVVESLDHPPSPPHKDLSEPDALAQLCAWIPDSIRQHCHVREIVRRGNAAEQVIEAARTLAADVIVLGVQHKRFFDTTVIGTTTVRVTRHAPCPVLVIPDGDGVP